MLTISTDTRNLSNVLRRTELISRSEITAVSLRVEIYMYRGRKIDVIVGYKTNLTYRDMQATYNVCI